MQALSKTGYDCPLSHEIFNDIFRRSDPVQAAQDGNLSSRYLESMLPQKHGEVPPPIGGGAGFAGREYLRLYTARGLFADIADTDGRPGSTGRGAHHGRHAECRWHCVVLG